MTRYKYVTGLQWLAICSLLAGSMTTTCWGVVVVWNDNNNANNRDWFSRSNWDQSIVPGSSDDVRIDTGDPQVRFRGTSMKTLRLSGQLSINSFGSLTTGTLHSDGELTVDGPGSNLTAIDLVLTSSVDRSVQVTSEARMTVVGTTSLLGFAGTDQIYISGGVFQTDRLIGNGRIRIESGELRVGMNDGHSQFDGVIVGNANIGLTKVGSGNLALFGSNLYSGITKVEDGILFISRTSLPIGAEIQISSPGRLQRLDLNNLPLVLGDVTNAGMITTLGQSNIAGTFQNAREGQVRIGSTESMLLSGASNINEGEIINLGGTLESTTAIMNDPVAKITGRGLFNFGDGRAQTGLINEGLLLLNGGASDVFGQVNLKDNGRISLIDSSTVFYDPIVHHGAEIRVGSGSTASFRGTVLADGPFLGAGLVEFDNDVHIAPNTRFAGDVAFTTTSTLHVELDGSQPPPPDFTMLDVTGELTFDGTLKVKITNGLELQLTQNDTFTIAIVESGTQLNLRNLVNNRLIVEGGLGSFAVSLEEERTLVLTDFEPVPEPMSLMLWTFALASLTRRSPASRESLSCNTARLAGQSPPEHARPA